MVTGYRWIGIVLVTVLSSLPAVAATLRVGHATAEAGSSTRVAVSLDDVEEDVRALQFTLTGVAPGMRLEGVEASAEAVGLNADAHQQEDGTVKVVLLSLGEDVLPAGSGPILDLSFTVGDTLGVHETTLTPVDVRIVGVGGEVEAGGEPGRLRIGGATVKTSADGDNCAVSPGAPTAGTLAGLARDRPLVRNRLAPARRFRRTSPHSMTKVPQRHGRGQIGGERDGCSDE